MTRLVTVAHGTRHAPGNEVARRITAAAAHRLGLEATPSYVELCEPLFADVMAADVAGAPTDAVVVPLLLSRGYHVAVDLPAAVLHAAGDVTLTPPLGPHPLLATALGARLLEAGAVVGSPVVLVAAGSRDPKAADDVREAAHLLSLLWQGPVDVAAFAGPLPRPEDVVRPEHAVSPYLLAPGFFSDRARAAAEGAGAHVVADVIGDHEAVVDLVVDRALSSGGGAGPRAAKSTGRMAS